MSKPHTIGMHSKSILTSQSNFSYQMISDLWTKFLLFLGWRLIFHNSNCQKTTYISFQYNTA